MRAMTRICEMPSALHNVLGQTRWQSASDMSYECEWQNEKDDIRNHRELLEHHIIHR
jgi:hypothetical protein